MASKYIQEVAEVSPREAWEQLEADGAAQLVDVRTAPEWQFTGAPDLAPIGRKALFISWKSYPEYTVNPHFAQQLAEAGVAKDTKLYFLCRSGGRSYDAAEEMIRAGYAHCYNVIGGFEGAQDGQGHRGAREGWKAEGLPWAQG